MSFYIDSTDFIQHKGRKLYRMIYNDDIYYKVNFLEFKLASKGDKGGYIESLHNVEQGDYIDTDHILIPKSYISCGYICENSIVYGNACIKKGGVLINSQAHGNVKIDNGAVINNAKVSGNGLITNYHFIDNEKLTLKKEILDGKELDTRTVALGFILKLTKELDDDAMTTHEVDDILHELDENDPDYNDDVKYYKEYLDRIPYHDEEVYNDLVYCLRDYKEA